MIQSIASARCLLRIVFTGLTLVLCLWTGAGATEGAKLKALIVNGQNNHRWQETTPVICEILAETGLFDITLATSPPIGSDMTSFRPDFAAHDVVVSNYNGDPWPAQTQADFVNYMRNGGGFVSIHAANNAFPEWPEYNEIIGLGGWGDRDESSGPYVFFRDGQVEQDFRPGRGGTHGARRPFVVTVRNLEHPITKGLPTEWKHARDELYGLLRGPAKNLTVLATALSNPKNYAPEHEPMLMTVEYGKGRTFHTTLGHDVHAMRCAGFAITLQRGTEWAATGQVTQPKPSKGFPKINETQLRAPFVPSQELLDTIAKDRALRKAVMSSRKAAK